MREVVLDTETTGLDPAEGHRVVEIGAVELWNHLPTGLTFHHYLNPERPMPPEAQAVHGLDDAFLKGKPMFRDIAAELIAFLGDAPMIAHNAGFDARFLNAEFRRIGLPPLDPARVIDTRALAMARFPGSPSSLDALCRRFGVDNSARTKHGALLDSEILAEVYLELVGGRQPGFGLAPVQDKARQPGAAPQTPRARPRPLAPRFTPAEAEAHAAFVAAMGADALWRRG